jgi:hypothetical protein
MSALEAINSKNNVRLRLHWASTSYSAEVAAWDGDDVVFTTTDDRLRPLADAWGMSTLDVCRLR